MTSALRKWGIRGAFVVLAGAGASQLPKWLARPPLEVKTVTVTRGSVRDVVTSSTAGEVVASMRATVRAEIGARVMVVKRKRGDRVKRGDLVIALDAADLEARLAQARASHQSALAQFDEAKARIVTLERQAERARNLAERGAGTTQMSEDAQNALAEAREALRVQAGMVAQAEAAVKLAIVARDKTELAAPFDGLLIEVLPDPGEALLPGADAFEIIDDRRLHVDAAVDEADSARVKIGQEATLTLDALPGRQVAGRVSRVAPAVKRDLKGARTLPIEVEVSDVKAALDAGLRVGMSANVEIVVAEKRDVVWLPTNVIIGRGTKRTVFHVEGERARQSALEVGLANWDRTEVLAGVVAGEQVISSLNIKGLDDGARIKITP